MVYMGSKAALVSELGPILQSHLISDSQWYIECFMGGGNMISMIDHPLRWGNDYNDLLPEMFSYLQSKVYFDERTCEWCFPEDTFPTEVSKEEYIYMRGHKEEFPKWLVAYVGFCCSFKATFFQGYAGKMYQDRNRASIFKQFTAQYHNGMRGVKLTAGDYRDMDIPRGSLLYLDPPYANTSAYKSSAGSINKFDHPAFYRWCVSQVKDNECSVFLSEYTKPDYGTWDTVWQQIKFNNMYSGGGPKPFNVEKLFRCLGE